MGGKKIYELMLEIGHKSSPLKTKLASGYTHKWTAYVRGVNNSKIEHCIQRVVFQLHESFENPYRDISEPPFQVKETGYAGFNMPIEIYFKNRDKPNHIVLLHDLCLLTHKPNKTNATEKLKFINPNREFEKCLIKSGAQLLQSIPKEKKERSHSPPAKKHKSSSLTIPSKDMSKHQPKSSSKEFLDVFGAPLVYKSHKAHGKDVVDHKSSSLTNNDHSSTRQVPLVSTHPQAPSSQQPSQQSQLSQQSQPLQGPPQVQSHLPHQHLTQNQQQSHIHIQNLSTPQLDPLQAIQAKISCLSDCDRLQKIVDIIDEAGEWFNLTPKKFEFDLKRLDKKTLSKIEKCLESDGFQSKSRHRDMRD